LTKNYDHIESTDKTDCYLLVVKHKKYTMQNGEIRCETCGVLWSELGLDN